MIQLSDIVTQAEHAQPDSFGIVTGDFNNANPKKEMPKFIHKGVYRSIPRAPLGPRHGLRSADLQTAIEVC